MIVKKPKLYCAACFEVKLMRRGCLSPFGSVLRVELSSRHARLVSLNFTQTRCDALHVQSSVSCHHGQNHVIN